MSLGPESLRAALAGRYAIEAWIGCMDRHWLARDLARDRKVVVDFAPHSRPDRVRRSISIWSRLRHPNLIPLIETGEIEGVPYTVSPFYEADTLERRVQREGQFSRDDAMRITTALGSALQHMHDLALIHRGLTPRSVLLLDTGPMIVDLESALDRAEAGGDAPLLPDVAYISPEQVMGLPEDGRVDVYALGCLLFEMLAGQPPFSLLSAASAMYLHATAPPPAISEVRPDLPESLSRVIRRAMAKRAEDRFATPTDFVRAVEPALGEVGA